MHDGLRVVTHMNHWQKGASLAMILVHHGHVIVLLASIVTFLACHVIVLLGFHWCQTGVLACQSSHCCFLPCISSILFLPLLPSHPQSRLAAFLIFILA